MNIVFCFGPRLGQKTEVWAQAEQKDWSFASKGGGEATLQTKQFRFLSPATIFIASRCIYQSKVNSDFLAGSLRVNIVHGGGGEGKKDLYLVIQLLDM